MRFTYLRLSPNVLLRWAQSETAFGRAARDAVGQLWRAGHTIYITPQNLVELWSVATRQTDVNGHGMTPDEADGAVLELEALFPLLPDGPIIHTLWRKSVVDSHVSGVNAHDARLAAALTAHNIDALLTFNVRHFSRFGITAVTPDQILAAYPGS